MEISFLGCREFFDALQGAFNQNFMQKQPSAATGRGGAKVHCSEKPWPLCDAAGGLTEAILPLALNITPRHASNQAIMKSSNLTRSLVIAALTWNTIQFTAPAQEQPTARDSKVATDAKANAETEKKAAEWVGSLALGDAAKEARVTAVVATHLKTIRDWHNEHPYTTVPAGINPVTGKPLSTLDRQMIADSAMPKSVHENLMTGLRKDLTEEQVEAILDKYTIGKVAFTMKGYKAIVPDLTAEEEKTILGFLKQARAEAVDYKSMPQISAIFEIYKTKSEQYLNSNGRDWKKLYKAYTDAARAKKAEAAKQQPKPTP
jgi:Protein of unknown function (DUF3826)